MLFAVLVGIVVVRQPLPRGLATFVVWVNAAWVAASLVAVLVGMLPLTMLGVAFVLLQAAAVALLATLQAVGLGRTAALA